jgi:GWxTD domain-containing protein
MRRLMPCAVLALATAWPPMSAAAQFSGGRSDARDGAGAQLSAVLARADALVANGDSSAALTLLSQAVRSDPSSAEAWHRRGMLAWRTARVAWASDLLSHQVDAPRLAVADEALQNALEIAPDSPRYLIDRARFLLSSQYSLVRMRAGGMFERALDVARRTNDHALAGEAADALGLLAWHDYEDVADRHIYSTLVSQPNDASLINDPRTLFEFEAGAEQRASAQRFPGEMEYLESWERFSLALEHDPSNLRALKHAYMALAERQNWQQLHHVASARLAMAPDDAWAWMARGLASHRLRDETDATMAFDSALALFSQSERERYDRLARIIAPKDSAPFLKLSAPLRERTERAYWLLSDPLWLTPANEYHLEFLSRVAFAELRWSSEDYGLRGVDTDRGDIFVRYGPPPAVISFPPDPDGRGETRTSLLWWYGVGSAFVFRQIPGYGVAPLAIGDARRAQRLRDETPVSWANLFKDRWLDSIPVRVTRFRESPDSVDLFVVADVPVDSMVKGTDIARGAIDVAFSAYDWTANRVLYDSTRQIVDFRTVAEREMHTWRQRVPVGGFFFRVEALEPAAQRGARAAGQLALSSETDFGLSDLLIAKAASPKSEDPPQRWSQFNVLPSVGTIKRGQPFALIWETYALKARDEESRYRVQISLVRRGGQSGKSFGDRLRGVVGRSRDGDRVMLTYEKTIPARPTAVDYVTLDPGPTTAPGTYVLVVKLTDLVGDKSTTRESSITIIE